MLFFCPCVTDIFSCGYMDAIWKRYTVDAVFSLSQVFGYVWTERFLECDVMTFKVTCWDMSVWDFVTNAFLVCCAVLLKLSVGCVVVYNVISWRDKTFCNCYSQNSDSVVWLTAWHCNVTDVLCKLNKKATMAILE